jgi:phosphoadenosine phosphosulfate reductase
MSCQSAVIHQLVGDLASINRRLETLSAEQRVEWALGHLPGEHVLSSSFGVQSAVMLHLLNQAAPGIPVIFIDTGYHFAETYRFVDDLTERLGLNLQVYQSVVSPAWQEARHGKRWEQGLNGINQYNHDNKVEPMQRALRELEVKSWFSGLRRSQSASRTDVRLVDCRWNRYKIHPIADWTDRDIHRYLVRHELPYHPLRDQGYISVGDWHTTRALKDIDSPDQARFFGLTRECGLHEVT